MSSATVEHMQYVESDIPEGMTLAEYGSAVRTLERARAAAIVECERLAALWLEARAAGDVPAWHRLAAETVAADKASRKIERKLHRARKRAA